MHGGGRFHDFGKKRIATVPSGYLQTEFFRGPLPLSSSAEAILQFLLSAYGCYSRKSSTFPGLMTLNSASEIPLFRNIIHKKHDFSGLYSRKAGLQRFYGGNWPVGTGGVVPPCHPGRGRRGVLPPPPSRAKPCIRLFPRRIHTPASSAPRRIRIDNAHVLR